MFSWLGSKSASHLVVLAPGDAGRLADTAPTRLAQGLADAGILVVRFDFPACADDDAARDLALAKAIRAAASHRQPHQRLVLGGLSRGARVSVSLVDELDAVGVLGFGYPFHPRHSPDARERVAQLQRLTVPMLICQGTRDSHGNQQQVGGYRLPEILRLHWLEDANHALHPRPRSGHTQAEQLAAACGIAAAFIRGLS